MMYVVERMTVEDYGKMMTGSFNYFCENVKVEADTKEEAIEKARKEGYAINTKYVKSIKEIEAEREKRRAEEEARKKAEAEAKAKKEAREEAKAEAMGMTITEYKEYKKMIANKKRHETKIRKAYEEIERMKKEIAYQEKRVAYYEAKINEIEK